ncbi:hypothetical protein FQV37_1279 [Psychrobacter nivimaris]|uniref:Uncharacterized protein n=1 Tax=Psychrobacter nivimaris TaxID=281738 RepID=A0A6N7BWA5_9GAMM|nr:hypothetical protein FQV37_1279 [Psychrobacter nivimaris]
MLIISTILRISQDAHLKRLLNQTNICAHGPTYANSILTTF